MSVELNHTIIPASDKWVSAKFLADILNLEAGPEWGHFAPIRTANGVRSEEHTSELQSLRHLVCRLLLEKTNTRNTPARGATLRNGRRSAGSSWRRRWRARRQRAR